MILSPMNFKSGLVCNGQIASLGSQDKSAELLF